MGETSVLLEQISYFALLRKVFVYYLVPFYVSLFVAG